MQIKLKNGEIKNMSSEFARIYVLLKKGAYLTREMKSPKPTKEVVSDEVIEEIVGGGR